MVARLANPPSAINVIFIFEQSSSFINYYHMHALHDLQVTDIINKILYVICTEHLTNLISVLRMYDFIDWWKLLWPVRRRAALNLNHRQSFCCCRCRCFVFCVFFLVMSTSWCPRDDVKMTSSSFACDRKWFYSLA